MMKQILKSVTIGQAMFDGPALFNRLYEYDWYGGTLRQWVDELELSQGTNLLELGCGPGNLSAYLAFSGFNVTGADKSKKMIKRANLRETTAVFVEANAYDLSFADNEFDAVVSASLINVVPEPEKMLAEMFRILAPRGKVSVLFPLPKFDETKANEISKANNIRGLSASSMSVWAGVAKKMSVQVVEKHLKSAGFINPTATFYLDGAVAVVNATRP